MGIEKEENKNENAKKLTKVRKNGIVKKKNLKIKKKATTIILPTQGPDSNWKIFLEEQKKNPPKQKVKKPYFKRKNSKEDNSKKNPIWFDDVDPLLVQQECGSKKEINEKPMQSLISSSSKLVDETVYEDPEKITKYVALDCEMVGIGFKGEENALARVSLVNSNCECVYDKFVKPAERVVDYRTHVSGVRPSDLKNAPSYQQVQKEVADILKDKILVGHALHNDLKCLMLGHSRKQIRDTSKYKPFQELMLTKRPALKKLVSKILHEEIQSGEHSSVIDARATMQIFKLHRKEWEKSIYCKKTKEEKKPEIFIKKDEKKNKTGRRRKFNNKKKK